ncbi:MAG: hypothetical protein M3Y48_15065 [Actinomycetota bacterium]|nr:hypothetical protein [Actinomycetota bacterium]
MVSRRSCFEDSFPAQLRLHAAAEDIALGISVDGECPNVARGLSAARDAGDGGQIARIEGRELVRVFFEQPGVLALRVLR